MRSRQLAALAATAMLITAPLAEATAPGHNGRIVFAGETEAGIQLFTVRSDGSGLRQITSVEGDAVNPDWSPNGRRIAFELGDARHVGIAIMRKDGSALHELTRTGIYGQPAFTPNGRHIIHVRVVNNVDESIWSMRRDGTHRRRLTRNPFPGQGYDTDPNVSPNGRVVTFVRVKQPERRQALFSVRRDGSHLRQLTPYGWDVGVKHDWAPDGSRIAIITNADPAPGTSANVATIRPDGTGLRRLTHYDDGETNALTGSYSPNGRWIAYRLELPEGYVLSKVRPDGTESQPIRDLEFAPRYIDWGSHLVGG